MLSIIYVFQTFEQSARYVRGDVRHIEEIRVLLTWVNDINHHAARILFEALYLRRVYSHSM